MLQLAVTPSLGDDDPPVTREQLQHLVHLHPDNVSPPSSLPRRSALSRTSGSGSSTFRRAPSMGRYVFPIPYTHHGSAGGSSITIGLRYSTAFRNPSSTDINASSCSMLIAPS